MKRIYFVSDGNGHIKIGSSANPSARVASLQTGTAMKLTLMGHRPGGSEGERLLHDCFAEERVVGEWFRARGKLMEFLLDVVEHDWTEDMSAQDALDDWYDLQVTSDRFDVLYKQNEWASVAQGGH